MDQLSLRQQTERVNLRRREIRQEVYEAFKQTGDRELSETLRKLDRDILFWESHTDYSPDGLMKTLKAAEALERDEEF